MDKVKTDKNNLVGIIVAGVLAVIALILVISIVGALFGGGYKKPLKVITKAFNKQSEDVGDYLAALPKVVKSAYKDGISLIGNLDKDAKKTAEKEIKSAVKEFYGNIEDEVGKKAKMSYKITDKEKMSKSDLKDIKKAYASIADMIDSLSLTDPDTYEDIFGKTFKSKDYKNIASFAKDVMKDMEKVKVSGGYILTLDLKIEGKDDELEEEDVKVCVVKMNGKWCIEPLSTMAEYLGDDIDDIFEDLLDELDLPF